MDKVEIQTKLKWWPSLQDYNEAVQMPRASLQDLVLRESLPYTDALGLPRPITGSFASVYRMHCQDKDYALRLFLKNIEDQADRYALISDFVQHDDLPYTVTFDFLLKGIKCRGDWLPALKMEWVEGKPFDEYIVEHRNDTARLKELADSFVTMMQLLNRAGIAHGDLQHGNIIMCEKEIRLVDYDGMFVPAMKGYAANELGHHNYQHPKRDKNHFGSYLDNFSAWVIYASIKALEIDPRLLDQLGGADDCLLFRESDFREPRQSQAFAAFERHDNIELRKLGHFLRVQLEYDLAEIPALQLPLPNAHIQLDSIDESVSSIKSGPKLIRTEAPSWWKDPNSAAETELVETKTAENSRVIHVKTSQASVWNKPTANDFAATRVVNNPSLNQEDSDTIARSPELWNSAIPREVKYKNRTGAISPYKAQWLMIYSPAVWLMLSTLFNCVTVDEGLKVHGIALSAEMTHVRHWSTAGKGEPRHYTDVELEYTLDGKPYTVKKTFDEDKSEYKTGRRYAVRVLRSDPQVHEPFDEPPGSRQKQDLVFFLICLVFNLIVEAIVWRQPLSDRRLVKYGKPVLVKIDRLRVVTGKVLTYSADLTYKYEWQDYQKTIDLTKKQFDELKEGTSESALCDPNSPRRVRLYRFCQYQPGSPQAPVANIVQP